MILVTNNNGQEKTFYAVMSITH